eukprot:maker-scaffold465_size163580-snap-gene-0.18 protein:Tk03806 transcript:maker-scaffold465_size163580-snap-gene-0.18-mRNA-1 annotation:"latrophilin cirl"
MQKHGQNPLPDRFLGYVEYGASESVASLDSSEAAARVSTKDTFIKRSKRKSGYSTAYGCEGSRLQINCTDNHYLDIIRANYGRFSIAICNDHGNTDWSVNCMSPRTLRVIEARCSNEAFCDVPVDSTIFGDPCPGTFKYVEVHYACRKNPVSASTKRPPPPWIPMERGSNAWSNIHKHLGSSNLTGLEENAEESIDESGTDSPITEGPNFIGFGSDSPGSSNYHSLSDDGIKPKVIEVRVPKPFNFDAMERKPHPHLPISFPLTTTTSRNPGVFHSDSTTTTQAPDWMGPSETMNPTTTEHIQVMINFTQYCPPASARGLFWNWTKAGDTAVLQCPTGSIGFAKWRCGMHSNWASQAPSFHECRSLWLSDLDARLREGVAMANVSHSLAYYSGLQPLFAGDLALFAQMLKHMSERMHYEIQQTPSLHTRETMVTDLVQNVVRSGSNLIDRMNHRSWNDLSKDDIGNTATSLMIGLEENAFLLANSVTSEKIIIKPTDNILLSIRVMQSRNTLRQRFPSVESIESWNDHGDFIELASSALLQNGDNGAVRVIFSTFNQLDQLLTPRNGSLFVNSKIISASLGKGRHIELPEPVLITLKHLRTINVSQPLCVYWDYLSNAWSDEGCQVVNTNRTHTLCQCNHLTNFALLMKEGGPVVPLRSKARMSTHISTIVALVAAFISISVIVFFLVITWRRLKMSRQCRSALESSGLPCFHKSKDLADKDKGNKGNFYAVTPKLNGAISTQRNTNEPVEVTEAQQFFEHMISLQKNQDTLVANKRRNTHSKESSETQETNLSEGEAKAQSEGANGLNSRMSSSNLQSENGYPKRGNFARALSPYNHIYMEIDPTDEHTIYEPLTHSETYMMSTLSDMSEDNYNQNLNNQSDMSRQSSSRESRPLIRPNSLHERNLLHTISGVLHSQSVRIAPTHVPGTNTLNPMRRSMWATMRPQEGSNLVPSGSHTLGRVRPNGGHGVPILEQLRQQGMDMNTLHLVNGQPTGASRGTNPHSGLVFQHPNGGTMVPENSFLSQLAHQKGAQGQSEVPLQVTTINGSQFVCLNFNQNQPNQNGATYITHGQELPGSSNYHGQELPGSSNYHGQELPGSSNYHGQIQAPVHSQAIASSSGCLTNRPAPQFAHPLSESSRTSARGHPRSDARFSSFKVADAQIRLSDGIPVISDRSTHEILSEILLLATKRIRSLRTP